MSQNLPGAAYMGQVLLPLPGSCEVEQVRKSSWADKSTSAPHLVTYQFYQA